MTPVEGGNGSDAFALHHFTLPSKNRSEKKKKKRKRRKQKRKNAYLLALF